MRNRMSFTGGRELEEKLRKLADPKAADRLGAAALRKGAKHLEAAIIARAPVGTRSTVRRRKTKRGNVTVADYGRITTNIAVRKTKAKFAGADVELGITRRNAFWSKLVEFGTVNMRARPFVRPAVDAEGHQSTKIIALELGRAITRAFKRRGIALDAGI